MDMDMDMDIDICMYMCIDIDTDINIDIDIDIHLDIDIDINIHIYIYIRMYLCQFFRGHQGSITQAKDNKITFSCNVYFEVQTTLGAVLVGPAQLKISLWQPVAFVVSSSKGPTAKSPPRYTASTGLGSWNSNSESVLLCQI